MKPGYKTTEFIVTVALIVGEVAFAIADKLPARYAALAVTVSGAAYAIARGLSKIGPPNKAPTTVATSSQNLPPVTTRTNG